MPLTLLMVLAAALEAPATGAWEVDTQAGQVLVSQYAAECWPTPSADGVGCRPRLMLRCDGGEKEAYLYFSHGLPAAEGDLLVSFGDEPKPKKYWGQASQNGKSYFFTGGFSKGTDGFIRSLLEHPQMKLTVKPKKKEALPELTFDLRELRTALTDWRAACPIKEN
jgi:hypothetical protein